METNEELYQLWDEFLKEWPRERLAKMSLDDYSKAGSKDTFTYWLEVRLDKLGSIWGGTAFKFGVYSRQNTKPQTDRRGQSYSPTHAWYTPLGSTAEEAFERVRAFILTIVDKAAAGDLDGIDADTSVLGEATRWKIAFHYQRREPPCIVGVFTREALANYLSVTSGPSMAVLQKDVAALRSPDTGIVEFGKTIWRQWAEKSLSISKLSHGPTYFSTANWRRYLEDCRVSIGAETPKGQADRFRAAKTGSLFFLCHGNQEVALIGAFDSGVEPNPDLEGWIQRRYTVVAQAKESKPYSGVTKGWAPSYLSTFYPVSSGDLLLFERDLLLPHFGLSLEELNARIQIHRPRPVPDPVPPPIATPVLPVPNRIFYGPPGTGKTRALLHLQQRDYGGAAQPPEARRFSFVTFHQSYGYEEFVEGLRPVLDTARSGEIRYEIKPGVFKALCDRAKEHPDQRFAMFIDEINRGNVSKIFGELITLIEMDKRDPLNGSAPAHSVILPYSRELFSVPANVDLIGTMNTADRSLALLDTALRRRFEFHELRPDTSDSNDAPLFGVKVTTTAGTIDIRLLLERINERIEVLYDRDHCIGHSYFLRLKQEPDGDPRLDALASVFRKEIIPLLEEYFFEDRRKIHLILGDNQKPDPAQFLVELGEAENGLAHLFGANHGLDGYGVRPRYRLQPDALRNPQSYIGIYEPVSR